MRHRIRFGWWRNQISSILQDFTT